MESQDLIILTEDGARAKVGERHYNYYDMQPGKIVEISTVYNDCNDANQDIWFEFQHDNGSTSLLNGQRICTIAFAKRRGFKDA